MNNSSAETASLFERFRQDIGNENCGSMDYTRMAFEYAYNLGRKHEQHDSRSTEPALNTCPFCGSSNLKSGYRDGVGYVDCRNCHTTCEFYHGDNLIGRWNSRCAPATEEQRVDQFRAKHGVVA